jgi:hypothetical protein
VSRRITAAEKSDKGSGGRSARYSTTSKIAIVILTLCLVIIMGLGVLFFFRFEGHQEVNRAVSDAIGEPNGGNYARAVDITRAATDRPEAVKNFEIGKLIVYSFERPGSRRPPESLQQGLQQIERAAVEPSEIQEYAPQYLHSLFDEGLGTAPNQIPVDKTVAACWQELRISGSGDPKRCVALRQQRLPQLSTPANN